MLILFRSKTAFVGHFFLELRFIAVRRSLTILGAQVCELIACVREAYENAGNVICIVQFLISRIIFLR